MNSRSGIAVPEDVLDVYAQTVDHIECMILNRTEQKQRGLLVLEPGQQDHSIATLRNTQRQIEELLQKALARSLVLGSDDAQVHAWKRQIEELVGTL
jgi:hypothetical protein